MKALIDEMSSTAGWSVVNGSVSAVDWEEYRTDWIEGQLQVLLRASAVMSKTFSVDTQGMDTVGFYVCAVRGADRRITMVVWSGADSTEYEMEIADLPGDYRVILPYSSVTKIEFKTPAGQTEDLQMILSNLVAYKDEYPADILSALKSLLEQYQPAMPTIGTVGAVQAGAAFVTPQGSIEFLEKFTAFKIGDETHQVESVNLLPVNQKYQLILGQMFDGKTMVGSFPAGTAITLALPVLTNPKHREGVTPVLSVEGGYDPETIPNWTFNVDEQICTDTETPPNAYYRKRRGFYDFKFIVHGLYRSLQTKTIVLSVMSQLQGNDHAIWVNGQKLIADFSTIEDISFPEDRGETGELQFHVSVKAEVLQWQYQRVPVNTALTVTFNPT